MSPGNNQRRRHRSSSSRARYLFYSKSFRLLRPSKLEAIRFSAYAFVFVWSLVALGIAVHFESILQSSDLTRFIPYAIFTASVSLVTVLFIIAMVLIHGSHRFAIKTETAALGLIGIFWLALSILMATSPAEDAEVECFFDEADTEPTSGFATDKYQSQYRILVAAGCINAALFLGICLFLLFLSFRHYRQVKDWVEYTGQPLLGEKDRKGKEHSRSTSRGNPPLTTMPAKAQPKSTKPKEAIKAAALPTTRARITRDLEKNATAPIKRTGTTSLPKPSIEQRPTARATTTPAVKQTEVKPAAAVTRLPRSGAPPVRPSGVVSASRPQVTPQRQQSGNKVAGRVH